MATTSTRSISRFRRVPRDGFGVGGEGPAFALYDRIVGVGVEVDDRRQIEVDPQSGEGLGGGGGVTIGGRGIVEPAEFLVGNALGKAIDRFEPVHPPTLLIDRYEQRHRRLLL